MQHEAATRDRLKGLIRERSFGRRKVVLASGRESDFYFDLKPTMFHPEGASLLARMMLARLSDLGVDYVGGWKWAPCPWSRASRP